MGNKDLKCFKTPIDKILYISDILTDKAYNYIKYGLNMLYVYLNNLNKQTFSNQESIFIYMRKYYKTINIT